MIKNNKTPVKIILHYKQGKGDISKRVNTHINKIHRSKNYIYYVETII